MFYVKITKKGEHVGWAWRDDHDALLIGDLSRVPASMALCEAEEFIDRHESSVFLDYEYELVTHEQLLSGLCRTPVPHLAESSRPAARANK